jgi:hypothetical protein
VFRLPTETDGGYFWCVFSVLQHECQDEKLKGNCQTNKDSFVKISLEYAVVFR